MEESGFVVTSKSPNFLDGHVGKAKETVCFNRYRGLFTLHFSDS